MKMKEITFGETATSIKPTKPKTPQQQRIASLDTVADQARDAVKAERKRQQLQNAQLRVRALQQVKPN